MCTTIREWGKGTVEISQERMVRQLGITQGMFSKYERAEVPRAIKVPWRIVEVSKGAFTLEDCYPKWTALGRERRPKASLIEESGPFPLSSRRAVNS